MSNTLGSESEGGKWGRERRRANWREMGGGRGTGKGDGN